MAQLPVRADRHVVVPAAQVRERGGLLSFLGSQERTGAWDVPRHLRVFCAIGAVELDLREARIPDGESVIEVVAWFGSVEILLPPGIHVEFEGDALAGEFSFQRDPTVVPPPDAPRVRLRGSAIFAAVECESRFAGEGKRAAAKRIKAARG